MRRFILVTAVLAAAVPAPAAAQRYDEDNMVRGSAPKFYLDASIDVGQASGEFRNYVDAGIGLRAGLRWRPSLGPLGFRMQAVYLIYGSTTNQYPLLPGINVDVTTNNQIAGLNVGPQLSFGSGAIQSYVYGSLGFSYFVTSSSAEGSDNVGQPFARSTNYDDITMASEGAGGLLIRLANRRTPVYLDLGARYLNNGRVTYVTQDGLSYSGNQLIVSPVDSKANLIIYHLGVSIGLRAPGPKQVR